MANFTTDSRSLDKEKTISRCGDRLVVKDQETLAARLARSLETALDLADGLVFADDAKSGQRTVSARFACPVSGFTIDEVEPRLFSFNNPFGACHSCDGLGVSAHFEEQLIVPDTDLSCAAAHLRLGKIHQILCANAGEPGTPFRFFSGCGFP